MLAKDELGCLYVGQQNHWPNILEIKPAFVVMIGDFFLRIKTDYNAILRYFWKNTKGVIRSQNTIQKTKDWSTKILLK
jgi:hypothetical protein